MGERYVNLKSSDLQEGINSEGKVTDIMFSVIQNG